MGRERPGARGGDDGGVTYQPAVGGRIARLGNKLWYMTAGPNSQATTTRIDLQHYQYLSWASLLSPTTFHTLTRNNMSGGFMWGKCVVIPRESTATKTHRSCARGQDRSSCPRLTSLPGSPCIRR